LYASSEALLDAGEARFRNAVGLSAVGVGARDLVIEQ
jgi:hypothetical protein